MWILDMCLGATISISQYYSKLKKIDPNDLLLKHRLTFCNNELGCTVFSLAVRLSPRCGASHHRVLKLCEPMENWGMDHRSRKENLPSQLQTGKLHPFGLQYEWKILASCGCNIE